MSFEAFMSAEALAAVVLVRVVAGVSIGFFDAALTVQGAYIQHWRGVDMLGIHHLCHSLQRRDDHRLFPVLQIDKLAGELVLQRHGGSLQGDQAFIGEVGVNLALVALGALPKHQLTLFQA